MTDNNKHLIKNFFKQAKAKIHECGLVAAINVADPYLRDDKAMQQTRDDIDAAILIPAIGIGAAAGIAFSKEHFPLDEAKGIASIFVNADPNYTPTLLTTLLSTGAGLAVGAKLSSIADKMLLKAKKRNDARKEKLKNINPEKLEKIDGKNAIRAEKHITRNDRIKEKINAIEDKIFDAREARYRKHEEKAQKRFNAKMKKLAEKHDKDR